MMISVNFEWSSESLIVLIEMNEKVRKQYFPVMACNATDDRLGSGNRQLLLSYISIN